MRTRRIAARHAAASPGSAARRGAPRHARAGWAVASPSEATGAADPSPQALPRPVSVTSAALSQAVDQVIDLAAYEVREAQLVGAGGRGGPVRRPPAPRGAPRLPSERPPADEGLPADPLDEGPLDPFLDDDLAAVLDAALRVADAQLADAQPADAQPADVHVVGSRIADPQSPAAVVDDPVHPSVPSHRAAPRHARLGRPAPVARRGAARHARGALPAYRHAAARPGWLVLGLAVVVARLVSWRDRVRTGRARLVAAVRRPFAHWKAPRLGLASASRTAIVAALGVVTIVAPAAGVAGPITPSGTAAAGALDLPRARAALITANYRAIIPDPPSHVPVPGEAVAVQPTGLSSGQLTAISAQAQVVGAAQGHASLPGCTGVVVQQGAENGKLNVADLCELPFAPGKRLRADAALALARMNAEYFVAFGRDMCIGDAYRSFEEQQAVRARKPGLAAPAGMSNHGWALAVDLCDGAVSDTTPEYAWFAANAGKFGWANPEWALQGGRGPHEPWHWEFAAAVAAQRAQAGLAPISGN